MARVRTGAGAFRSLGLFVVVWLVDANHTNTGSQADVETSFKNWQRHSCATLQDEGRNYRENYSRIVQFHITGIDTQVYSWSERGC